MTASAKTPYVMGRSEDPIFTERQKKLVCKQTEAPNVEKGSA